MRHRDRHAMAGEAGDDRNNGGISHSSSASAADKVVAARYSPSLKGMAERLMFVAGELKRFSNAADGTNIESR